MTDNPTPPGQVHKSSARGKTIGIFLSSTDDKFENMLLRGLSEAVTSAGANLICFTSGAIRSYHGFESQRNLLYDLLNKDIVHGLAISATLGHNVSKEELLEFLKRYQPLPLVTAAVDLEEYPSVVNGGWQGVTDAVTHLIETHGYQDIAFIRGPAGHPEADERFNAYCETLQTHNLDIREQLVLQGDYTFESGRSATQKLLECAVPFQAIVSANDSMAFGALNVLNSHGLSVPEDTALVGFDDTEDSRQSSPPLTTIRQSVYGMGKQAGRILLGLILDQAPPQRIVVPSQLVIRQSCGCANQRMQNAAFLPSGFSSKAKPKEGWKIAVRHEMQRSLSLINEDLILTWMDRLIAANLDAIRTGSSSLFLDELHNILSDSLSMLDDGSQWQDVISVLRRNVLATLDDMGQIQQAEMLWQQARILIGDQSIKAESGTRLHVEHRNMVLRELSEALMSCSTMTEVFEVIALDLPRIGIKACHLSLFDELETSAEWSRLMLSFDENTRHPLPADGIRFRSSQLMPENIFEESTSSNWVAEVLYAKEQRLGFMLLNVAPEDASVCGALRGLISNALQAVILNEIRKKVEEELQSYQKSLENLVETRTIELQNTNQQLQDEIKERQRNQVERENLIHELEEKNTELERFTYTVSHDLKSPLVTINGFLGYLEEDAASGNLERLRQDIHRIQEAVKKMQSLLDELLELSRIGRIMNPPQEIRFDHIVREALDNVQGQLDANHVSIEVGPNLPTVFGDYQRLKEVLQNLIDNATKFMGEQPVPVIEIGQRGEEAGHPVLYVKDNGIGIAPEYHDRIFNLFERLDTKTEGTGIGLAIVKRIIELHGGRIWIESQTGKGTTFLFTLSYPPAR